MILLISGDLGCFGRVSGGLALALALQLHSSRAVALKLWPRLQRHSSIAVALRLSLSSSIAVAL